jgi:hypothetical protein
MSTVWKLTCTNPAGDKAQLEITKTLNPLPGSDTWRAPEGSAVWGEPTNGYVANWNTGETLLHAGAATLVHSLTTFTKHTVVGDTGNGTKVPTGGLSEGTFPDGPFTWSCDSKS